MGGEDTCKSSPVGAPFLLPVFVDFGNVLLARFGVPGVLKVLFHFPHALVAPLNHGPSNINTRLKTATEGTKSRLGPS